MSLESGPAKTDSIYWTAVTVACLGLAAYFFYDGKWGYLRKNRAEAARKLQALLGQPLDPAQLGATPTKADFDALRARRPLRPAQVHQALGRPIKTRLRGRDETIEYFASVYGLATVPIHRQRVDAAAMTWAKWFKTRAEIRQQYYWGLVPLLIGLYAALRAYRAISLRVVIDQEGMTYGRRRIRFAEMTGLRDYNRKGWVDLYYRTASGEKRLRLDNQKVARFEEIAEEICRARGFANPLAPPRPSGAEALPPGAPDAGPAPCDRPDRSGAEGRGGE